MQEILPPEKPPRHRHDGWTPQRQQDFLATLAKHGSVQEACASVGKSTTSAYKARYRIRGFRNRWDDALDQLRPTVEAEVRRRAIEGYDEPVFQNGRQVGVRRKYSDPLLKMMAQGSMQTPQGGIKRVSLEDVEKEVLRMLYAGKEDMERRERAAAIDQAERMRAAGLCP